MTTPKRDPKDSRLALRISSRQRSVISEAAEAAEKDVTSFVLDAALTDAQRVLAERRLFNLSPEGWARFNDLLDRPTTPLSSKPKLEKLLLKPSVLER
jgi:uncharacterized protein (DUF1778 family)